MIYGLLGERLRHSYSPVIHKMLCGYDYQLFEKKKTELTEFLTNGKFDGINVTIPYKKSVIPYCSELSEEAKLIGSVNTIIRDKSGNLKGFNTDYFGFLYMVKKSKTEVKGKKILILGSGGASLTVNAVMQDLNAGEIITVSRNGENNYNNINKHFNADIIVNTTPVGMYPDTGASPIDIFNFAKCSQVFDLIYNPSETKLLCDCKKAGIKYLNGLSMLVAQAKKSAEIFTGKTINDIVIEKIVESLNFSMKNIVLIGMPGSGKSYIGKKLAKECNRDFIDIDNEIVLRTGMKITEIFQSKGEEYFRKLETQLLSEYCKLSGKIISTGGGAVTRPENYLSIRQNSTVIWLKRELTELPTEGRPISISRTLEEIYNERKPLYEKFSDFSVENSEESDAVKIIMERCNENTCY